MPDINMDINVQTGADLNIDIDFQQNEMPEINIETAPPGPKGEKGDPGENGVSATHSWNGTVLSVTSASGTSSADLKGEKGDKGDKGNTGVGIASIRQTTIGIGGGAANTWQIQLTDGQKQDITLYNGDNGRNGTDGYTPVKGKDYFDGKDGYTPVKGVDYFDGRDGKDNVYIGPEEPADPDVRVWIKPDGEAVEIPEPYTLPTASADVKGGVKVGEGLRMDGDVLSTVDRSDCAEEIIRTITVSDERQIVIDEFETGESLALESVMIDVDASKSADFSVTIEYRGNLYVESHTISTSGSNAYTASRLFKLNGAWQAEQLASGNAGRYGATYSVRNISRVSVQNTPALTSIRLTINKENAAGTVITIKGVRSNA